MSQYLFGTGQLFASNVGGGNPLRIGALQNVEVGFSGDLKELFGQYQFPLAVARGKTKVEGKFGTGNIDVAAFNALFFAEAAGVTSGQYKQAINEAGAVPGTGPYTVVVANGAHFFRDLGVTDVLTGKPLKYVTSAVATGEYMVDPTTGTYTFAAADTGKAVLFNYIYQDTTAGGTLTIANQLMGVAPTLELICSQTFQGNVTTLCLFSVTVSKLQLPLKMDDFAISDCDFQAQANSAGNIGFITTTSASGGGA
jgi:hypothetical protein